MKEIKSKRVINLLLFGVFFAFFVSGFSQLMIIYITSIKYFLIDTFLEPIINLVYGFTTMFFKTIKYLSLGTLISCLVSVFIVFYQDFIKESSVFKI